MSEQPDARLEIGGSVSGVAIVGSVDGSAVIAGSGSTIGAAQPADVPPLQALLAAVIELQADVARFAETIELRRIRADLDAVQVAAATSSAPDRDTLVRLQERLTAMNTALAGLLSATAVAEAISRLLG